jgi:hypothetical protein
MLVVLVLLAVRSLEDGPVENSAIAVLPVVAIVAAIVLTRNYRRAVEFAANHTVTVGQQHLLIRDGAVEQTIPYNAIEFMRVRHPPFGAANFQLKVSGIPMETYYGYDNIDALISSLISRIPRERVRGADVHA